MKLYESIDDYRFTLSKHSWTSEDHFSAACVGMKKINEQTYEVDVRLTWPEAFISFLDFVFPGFQDPIRAQQKKAVLNQIRNKYKRVKNDFDEIYKPSIQYEKTPWRHQFQGWERAVPRKVSMFAFEQGLGKTIESITLSKITRAKRTIIITTSLIKWSIYDDMTKDWGYNPLYWTIWDATRSKCVKAFVERFVVINYESIPKYYEQLTSDDCQHIIIDECHKIKNPSTRNFKEVKKLLKNFKSARVTLLSGTPMPNRVIDLFGYFKLVNHPLGQNKKWFKERYELRKGSGWGSKVIGIKNEAELKMRMSNFMIRKKTEECIDLPELIIKKFFFDMDDIQEEYNQIIEEMYQSKVAKEEAMERNEIQQSAGNLKQNIHTLNRLLATSKAKKAVELIDSLNADGKKVIVFCSYKYPLEWLKEHYKDKSVMIDGSVPSHKRKLYVDKFKEDNEDCMILLGQNKAAGIGINVTNAHNVIFLNMPFTPDDLEQPYKRAHRPGQKLNVLVYYLMCRDSIDEHVYSMILSKTNDINSLIDEGKKGVVHYGSIENEVFNILINQYKSSKGIAVDEFKQV